MKLSGRKRKSPLDAGLGLGTPSMGKMVVYRPCIRQVPISAGRLQCVLVGTCSLNIG